MSDGRREERAPYLPDDYYLGELAERDLVILRRPGGCGSAWGAVSGSRAGGGERPPN